ncbi:murein L,D-transpeptidase [Algoriphagus sp.]|uniref:L,D-transpeptidase family protein n=1 Tax=Algoriphagus sp. TaxID=1872435 RepID=UPI00391A9ABD
MKKVVAIGLGVIVILGVLWFTLFNKKSDLTEELQGRLASETSEVQLKIGQKLLTSSGTLRAFYAEREFAEAWSQNGKLTKLGEELRFEIGESKYDGLNPEDYHAAEIELLFQAISDQTGNLKTKPFAELADLDLLLTDAFFSLAKDLEIGKVDPSTLKSAWDLGVNTPSVNYHELLNESIRKGSIKEGLESLYPEFKIYRKGREVIRDLAEKQKTDTLAWKPVNLPKSLKVGDTNDAIPQLRNRLIFWDFLQPYEFKNELVFDSLMEEGLKKYQSYNGMEPDGAIGNLTAESLNNSPAKLMDIAAVNMERMRWLSDTLRDTELILVNVANYQLDYLVKLDTVLTAKVIVGEEYNASPVFSAPMTYIAFSPYWNIPTSIVKDEIAPAMRKNPKYLDQKNMEVITSSGQPVNVKPKDWTTEPFPYLIRQKPGASNSLGLVKFMFPNEHSIYIHDTPARSLFNRENRALSHGCIRIQDPAKFAALLLQDDPSWTAEKIDLAMHQEKEQIVQLKKHIPVVIFYLTFWADSDGVPNFRSDIYNRDQEVLAKLKASRTQ